MKSKISGGVVTAKKLHYEGSITVDARVLRAAGILPGEQVHVLNGSSGARFETYAIAGRAGVIELNGPAARLGEPGDEVIVLAYGAFRDGENCRPRIVRLRSGNRLSRAGLSERGSPSGRERCT